MQDSPYFLQGSLTMKYAYLILVCKAHTYDATENKVWDGQHDAWEMWLGWPGLHRCLAPLPLREGKVPKPLQGLCLCSLLTDTRLLWKLATGQFMQSRGVVRKDEITCIHSVSLACTSYYVWPKFTTEKVPKDSPPFLGPPGDNSGQKPVSFFLGRSRKPFSFQKGQTNPCSCHSKYFRRQIWLLFWRHGELYAWIVVMLSGTWMAKSWTYIQRELFFYHFTTLILQKLQARGLCLSWLELSSGGSNGQGAGYTWIRTIFRRG